MPHFPHDNLVYLVIALPGAVNQAWLLVRRGQRLLRRLHK
jgi:hypothetical protein